eukprot:scpid66550/ scgid23783/ 
MSRPSSQSQVVGIIHKGWLWKHGGRVRNWKRRFFVLTTTGRLTYYDKESDAESGTGALGIIDIQKALYVTRRVKEEEPGAWPDAAPVNVCFTIITNDRNYGVYSEQDKDADSWVKVLQMVRGDVDKSDITVEQASQTQQAPQRRSSMSSHMANFCQRYKLMELSPKLQMMWLKWNNVGQRALKAMADHFGIVEEIMVACDAGDMYKRLPTNRRTRVGEYVFADYMDEIRYNVCKEFGDEDVAKAAFRAAFGKRKIKVEMKDGDSLTPNTVELVDGVIVLTVYTARFGGGIHLAGQGLTRDVLIQEQEEVCGASVEGMTVETYVDIARHLPALEKASAELQAKLPRNPSVKFLCNYRQIQSTMADIDSSIATQPGSAIIQPIIVRLITDLMAFIGRASPETVERIAGESSDLVLAFKIGLPEGDDDPAIELNADGHVVIVVTGKKLVEISQYTRPPNFNLEKVFA